LANSKQAKKRARQAETARCRNASRKSEMRTYLKQTTKAIEDGNTEVASKLYTTAASTVDRMASSGIIHKNKAARHKSRLNARIKKLVLAGAPAAA
jgi:small subunit ribosomal protein S20